MEKEITKPNLYIVIAIPYIHKKNCSPTTSDVTHITTFAKTLRVISSKSDYSPFVFQYKHQTAFDAGALQDGNLERQASPSAPLDVICLMYVVVVSPANSESN